MAIYDSILISYNNITNKQQRADVMRERSKMRDAKKRKSISKRTFECYNGCGDDVDSLWKQGGRRQD